MDRPDLGTPVQMIGCTLHLTCAASPEQYDVFKDGQQIGYLRLRHGEFIAEYGACDGPEVFSAKPD